MMLDTLQMAALLVLLTIFVWAMLEISDWKNWL